MTGRRPNIILFNPETIRADAVFGDPAHRARTPHLDRLAGEATTFPQAYCQAPYCGPSRIGMFTGLYPHTAGHRSLVYLLNSRERNLFMDLKEAGYRTFAFGKNDLLAQDAIPLSFDETDLRVKPVSAGRHETFGPGHKHERSFYFGCRTGDCRDNDWASIESALSVIDEGGDRPFCIFLPLGFAHPPYVAEEPYFSMHDRAAMPPPIPYQPGRRRFMDVLRPAAGCDRLDESDFREIKATYFGMVSRVDHQMGQLIERLRQRGLWDNTVFAYFTDHGDYAGDYGMIEKFLAGFEDCLVRAPLVVRAPGVAGGRSCDRLVEMTDLYATITELAGVQPKHYHFSRSLLPAMRGEAAPWRDAVFAEGGRHADERQFLPPIPPTSVYEPLRRALVASPRATSRAIMVRTDRWKYTYCPADRDELFDLTRDPDELRNLADDPAHASVRAELRERLLRWMLDTGDVSPLEQDPRGWRP